MGKSIGAGCHCATDRRQWSAKNLQSVTDIVETDRVSQLRVEHGYHMTPGRERARLLIDPALFGYFADQERGNEIANLP